MSIDFAWARAITARARARGQITTAIKLKRGRKPGQKDTRPRKPRRKKSDPVPPKPIPRKRGRKPGQVDTHPRKSRSLNPPEETRCPRCFGMIATIGGKIIRHRQRDSNTGTVNGTWCGYAEVEIPGPVHVHVLS